VVAAPIPALFGKPSKLPRSFTGKEQVYKYVDENRIGDHMCYISNLDKMRAHYPNWDITISLEETIRQIVVAQGTHK
jgi:CDP-paratose 2-epimerase